MNITVKKTNFGKKLWEISPILLFSIVGAVVVGVYTVVAGLLGFVLGNIWWMIGLGLSAGVIQSFVMHGDAIKNFIKTYAEKHSTVIGTVVYWIFADIVLVISALLIILFTCHAIKGTFNYSINTTTQTKQKVEEVVCTQVGADDVVKQVEHQENNTIVTFESGNSYIVDRVLTANKGDKGKITYWSKNGDVAHRALMVDGWPKPYYLINEGQ